MAKVQRKYDKEFKAQAVKLAQEIGSAKAAAELGIPDGTLYCWVSAFKKGQLESRKLFIHLKMHFLLMKSLLNSENV